MFWKFDVMTPLSSPGYAYVYTGWANQGYVCVSFRDQRVTALRKDSEERRLFSIVRQTSFGRCFTNSTVKIALSLWFTKTMERFPNSATFSAPDNRSPPRQERTACVPQIMWFSVRCKSQHEATLLHSKEKQMDVFFVLKRDLQTHEKVAMATQVESNENVFQGGWNFTKFKATLVTHTHTYLAPPTDLVACLTMMPSNIEGRPEGRASSSSLRSSIVSSNSCGTACDSSRGMRYMSLSSIRSWLLTTPNLQLEVKTIVSETT